MRLPQTKWVVPNDGKREFNRKSFAPYIEQGCWWEGLLLNFLDLCRASMASRLCSIKNSIWPVAFGPTLETGDPIVRLKESRDRCSRWEKSKLVQRTE